MEHKNFPSEDPIIEWKAPEHHRPERGKLWYIVATLFVVLCVFYSLHTKAWTFSALILVVTGLYWKLHKEDPRLKHVRIYTRGFGIDDTFTEWVDCHGYWICQHGDYYQLHVEKKSGARINIQLGHDDPYALHAVLEALAPELTDRRERLLDTIIRICKL